MILSTANTDCDQTMDPLERSFRGANAGCVLRASLRLNQSALPCGMFWR